MFFNPSFEKSREFNQLMTRWSKSVLEKNYFICFNSEKLTLYQRFLYLKKIGKVLKHWDNQLKSLVGLGPKYITNLLGSSIFSYKRYKCDEKVIFSAYRGFHRFGQAKFLDGGLVSGSSQLSILPQLPPKNTAQFKSGKNWPQNNHLASLI